MAVLTAKADIIISVTLSKDAGSWRMKPFIIHRLFIHYFRLSIVVRLAWGILSLGCGYKTEHRGIQRAFSQYFVPHWRALVLSKARLPYVSPFINYKQTFSLYSFDNYLVRTWVYHISRKCNIKLSSTYQLVRHVLHRYAN